MLRGKRILVLEDEPLVQMMLEDLLEDLGAIIVGPASCVAQANTLIDSEQLDAAILDLNLGGENSHSIAERLRGNGVPFVFATGYGTAGDGRLDDEQVIHKPTAATISPRRSVGRSRRRNSSLISVRSATDGRTAPRRDRRRTALLVDGEEIVCASADMLAELGGFGGGGAEAPRRRALFLYAGDRSPHDGTVRHRAAREVRNDDRTRSSRSDWRTLAPSW